MRLLPIVFAAVLFAGPAFAAPEPPDGSPPGIVPAVAMTDRPAAMIALDASRKPVEVLKFLGLKRGDRVLDVMAGGGYYSEIIGNAIGSKGHVLAEAELASVDTKSAEWAALVTRVPNVEILDQAPGDLRLPANSIDFTLMHLVYHDTYWESAKDKFARIDPALFLKRIYAATKPGGIVGVVDSIANPGGDTRAVVDKLHRIDPAVVRADFKAAGFKLEAESKLLANPADDHTRLVFDPAIRGKTDRLVYRFRKPL
ncbi:class I SAM-dependent methyltransferase [Glacieibacterium sp.]|uniref:class I SAM-dependent methyltransferase n=1 Tax=Glacieibacterium sp. TaxID=2860237 RepID=UPI003AFFD81F